MTTLVTCPDHGDLYRLTANLGEPITANGTHRLRGDIPKPVSGEELKCPFCGKRPGVLLGKGVFGQTYPAGVVTGELQLTREPAT